MDAFYDKVAAAEFLEDLSSDRREGLKNRADKHTMHLADVDIEALAIVEVTQGRRSWRLCLKDCEEEVKEEVVMRVQGILTKNNLVPKNLQSCSISKAQFLSQYAEICGAHTATFSDVGAKMKELCDVFRQNLAGVEVLAGDNVIGSSDTFSASNRVFTSKTDVPTEQDNDFQLGVDPMRMLEKLKSCDLIHAPDNIVKYFKRVSVDAPKEFSYEIFIPGGFRAGDVVEMQLCVVAVAAGKNAVKITTRLQALTLINDKFTKDASVARAAALFKRDVPTAIRRKIGYFQEDEADDRKVKKRRSGSPDEMRDE